MVRGGGDDDVERDERGDDAVEPGMDGDAIRRETNRPAGWGYLARWLRAKHGLAHLRPLFLRLGEVDARGLAEHAYAAELIKDDAHVEVEETERAQHDERQKEEKRRGIGVLAGLFVHLDAVQGVEHDLPVPSSVLVTNRDTNAR